jgi:sulfatase maturation enzyme AslB (radical SAM superfamily)
MQIQCQIDFSRHIDQPREVGLETFSKCNAACTFCPYPTLDRIDNKMSEELLDKIIKEMSEWKIPFFFSPLKVNEPLLDKRLFDILDRVVNETIGVIRLFSNGSALTPKIMEKIDQIPKDRFAHLIISLNEYRAEEYKNLMNLDFEHTVRNIDRLHASNPKYHVGLTTVGYPNEDFRYYCFKRWPNFESYAIRDSGWLGLTEAEVCEVPDTGCGRWWEMSIMSNGVSSLCCMDGEGQYGYGDVNNETLLEIYAKTRKWRVDPMMSRKDVGDPCNRCWN